MLFRLVKAGYGSYEEVKKLDARIVLQALNYEVFLIDYENALYESGKN
jgi:hypothetical protein